MLYTYTHIYIYKCNLISQGAHSLGNLTCIHQVSAPHPCPTDGISVSVLCQPATTAMLQYKPSTPFPTLLNLKTYQCTSMALCPPQTCRIQSLWLMAKYKSLYV